MTDQKNDKDSSLPDQDSESPNGSSDQNSLSDQNGDSERSGKSKFHISQEDKNIFLLILVTCGIFIVIAYVVAPAINLNHCESGAKKKLCEIGSTQLAYQGSNNDKQYGSFEALQKSQYIEPYIRKDSLIDGYTLSWKITNPDTRVSWSESRRGFTIIAYPMDMSRNRLRTFAITEDQILRVYNPDSGDIETSVESWDEIMRNYH